jgi:hypothetical protein
VQLPLDTQEPSIFHFLVCWVLHTGHPSSTHPSEHCLPARPPRCRARLHPPAGPAHRLPLPAAGPAQLGRPRHLGRPPALGKPLALRCFWPRHSCHLPATLAPASLTRAAPTCQKRCPCWPRFHSALPDIPTFHSGPYGPYLSLICHLQPSSVITLPAGAKVLLSACMLQQGQTYRQIVIPAGAEVGAEGA